MARGMMSRKKYEVALVILDIGRAMTAGLCSPKNSLDHIFGHTVDWVNLLRTRVV
jgi:hypothetical protein